MTKNIMLERLKRRAKRNRILSVIAFFVVMIIIFGIIALVYHSKFYYAARREFLIPAINRGLIPQGITYDSGSDQFLISGYMEKTNAAKICVTTSRGEYRMVSLLKENGKVLHSHSGGVTCFGQYVYVAGGNGRCYVYYINDLLTPNRKTIRMVGKFKTYNRSSFCSVNAGRLYVGEYYFKFRNRTADSHHLVTPGGDKNNAFITVFKLNERRRYGVDTRPEKVLSIRDRIQGICFDEHNNIMMSASSAVHSSKLYCYDYRKILETKPGKFKSGKRKLDIYYIDNENLIDTVQILPKSEEIVSANGRVYIIHESASEKFQYGKIFRSQYLYSIPLK